MAEEPESNFEQALAQLERIVASLERGEPELTAALSKYEKGVQLLSVCHRLLDQAEQSVAILTGVDPEGNPLTAPFDATATMAREASSPALAAAVATPNPTASEPARKSPERPSVRRGRTTPVDHTSDAGDPPF
jgi:exodeoxyribonuclease VII small subunit